LRGGAGAGLDLGGGQRRIGEAPSGGVLTQ
jgi:hypothetical protein